MKILGVILSLCFLSTFLNAQNDKKLALIIGNGSYEVPLKNPVNDANDVYRKLVSLGFDVELMTNLSKRDMRSSISSFADRASKYDAVLFYYIGHGLQVKGENYLVPVDAVLAHETDAEFECESLNHILANLSESDCRMKIVVLDACRNNPFERRWYKSAVSQGLSKVDDYRGTLIHYATAPGSVASDGAGRNSPYTMAFLEILDRPNLSLFEFFNEVSNKVLHLTEGTQEPAISAGALQGNFYFNRGDHLSYPSIESGASKEVTENIMPTTTERYINGHEFVDLGLSVKWATCNVGADSPEQYGGYFAWGETYQKASYSSGNSLTTGKTLNDISGNSVYDVASANWGATWRMPTLAEFIELESNCVCKWKTIGQTVGLEMVSKRNGNSIFFPASGGRDGWGIQRVNDLGRYWTSTPFEGTTNEAYYKYFYGGMQSVYHDSRYVGNSVRPVTE